MSDDLSRDPWRAFEHDPRLPANADLRASDRDRDAVSSILGAAYAEGRLTPEELDQRAEATARTRTLGEIPALVSDVVPGRAVTPRRDPHERALEEYGRDRRNAAWGFLSASLICWVVWIAASVNSGGPQFPWPLFVMLGTGLHLGRLTFDRHDRIAHLERKYEKRDRKRLEGPESSA